MDSKLTCVCNNKYLHSLLYSDFVEGVVSGNIFARF